MIMHALLLFGFQGWFVVLNWST